MTWTAERDRLQQHILDALQRDERVVACWLAGSHGRGTADEWSDIDLGIVLTDDAMPSVIEDPLAFVEAITPTIMHIEAPHIAPPRGAFLLSLSEGPSGPQEVDWYWYPESSARRPTDTHLVLERRPIPLEESPTPRSTTEVQREIDRALREAVQMAFITGKRIRRHDWWGIASHLRYLAECLGRAEWIAHNGSSPSYADSRQFMPAPSLPRSMAEAAAMLQTMVDRIDALSTQMASPTCAALPNLRAWLRGFTVPESTK